MQLKSVGASLSTRQLLRIARHMSVYPGENLRDILQKACLSKYVALALDMLSYFCVLFAIATCAFTPWHAVKLTSELFFSTETDCNWDGLWLASFTLVSWLSEECVMYCSAGAGLYEHTDRCLCNSIDALMSVLCCMITSVISYVQDAKILLIYVVLYVIFCSYEGQWLVR